MFDVSINSLLFRPYPDETFYSLLCRANRFTGGKPPRPTAQFLFGIPADSLCLPIPYSLNAFLTQHGLADEEHIRAFVEQTTFIRLYSIRLESGSDWPSLPIQSFFNAYDSLNSGLTRREQRGRLLAFCPKCVEDDLRVLGLSYWRLCHQFPGICECPHHHCRLWCHRYLNPKCGYAPTLQLPHEDPVDDRFRVKPICSWSHFHNVRLLSRLLSCVIRKLLTIRGTEGNRIPEYLVRKLDAYHSETVYFPRLLRGRKRALLDCWERLDEIGVSYDSEFLASMLFDYDRFRLSKQSKREADFVNFLWVIPFLCKDVYAFCKSYERFINEFLPLNLPPYSGLQ